MKTTRHLFVLVGQLQDVKKVLGQLNFKGLSVIDADVTTKQDILDSFRHNKSLVCRSIPEECHFSPNLIYISDVPTYLSTNMDYIYIIDDVAKQFQAIADKHNCDIGAPISDSSGLANVIRTDNCPYCKYLKGYSTPYEKTVYESQNFYVVPTYGEFVKGYLLIIPKKHIMSMAELKPDTFKEFMTVLQDIIYLLKLTYKFEKFLIWENGTSNLGFGKEKNSIVHAHTHVVPSNLTADKIENISKIKFAKIPNDALLEHGLYSYLLIRDGQNWRIHSDPKTYYPSQYIRQILATAYNLPENHWNWKKYSYFDLMLETSEDILLALRTNWSKLPERIQKRTYKYVF